MNSLLLLNFVLVVFAASAVVTQEIKDLEIQQNQCGGAIEADAGVLEPFQNLTNGQLCVWTIHLPTRSTFKFSFDYLDITGNLTNSNSTVDQCQDGAVRIYSLTNLIATENLESYTFCSEQPSSGTFFLSESVATIVAYTSAENESPGAGFSLTWEGVRFEPMPVDHSSTYSHSTSGIVRYPIFGQYPPNTINTWLINGDKLDNTNSKIDISLNEIKLEACEYDDKCLCDALIIYQINRQGILSETERFCGEKSNAFLGNQDPHFIAAFFADYNVESNDRIGFELMFFPTPEPTVPPSTTEEPTTTTEIISTTTESLPTTTTCGGVIYISEYNDGIKHVIEYKFRETYEPFSRCVWTVTAPFHSTISVIKEESAFERCPSDSVAGYDNLALYTLNMHNSSIQEENYLGCKTNGTESIILNGTGAVIVFTTDHSYEGTGFRLILEAVAPYDGCCSANALIYTSLYNESFGTFKFPSSGSYGNNYLAAIVITNNFTHNLPGHDQRMDPYVLTVPVMDIEQCSGPDGERCTCESLRVYKVDNGLEELDLLCGRTGSPALYKAPDMFILLFRSNNNGVHGTGFQGSWTQEPNHKSKMLQSYSNKE